MKGLVNKIVIGGTLLSLVFGVGCSKGFRSTTYEEKCDFLLGESEYSLRTGNTDAKGVVPQATYNL